MTETIKKKFPENFVHWFSRHYMLVINGILLVFLLLTLSAPIAMKLGWDRTACVLYEFFRRFCHQFAFRSWFLFGEQAYYPHYTNSGLISYEETFDVSPRDLNTASSIQGNNTAGYKVAICQRDFAMYSALLVIGLAFVLSGRRLARIPLWLWIIIGVLPLGIDGLSQMTIIPAWFPARESTPLIRTITGGLFGLLSGWYIYPSLDIELSTLRNNMLKE